MENFEYHVITSEFLWRRNKFHDLKTLFELRKDGRGNMRGSEDDGPLGGGNEIVDSRHEAFIPFLKYYVNLQENHEELFNHNVFLLSSKMAHIRIAIIRR